MNRIVSLFRSILRDAPIVGYRDYLMYRVRSFRGDRTPMQVIVEGQKILVRPSTPDLRVAFQSLRREFDILKTLLPADYDGIIVDAGGYIGAAARKLSTLYPRATVVSIEPSDANYTMLLRNIAGHPNIHAVKAALSATGGHDVALHDRGTGEWGFTIALQDGAGSKGSIGSVPTITMEEIAARFGGKPIGLVKLDIEGGEHAILKDPASALRHVPLIFVELHDRIVPGCSDVFAAFSADRWVINAGGEKHLSMLGKPAQFATDSAA
jgi:FkbM family methyltransferase